MVENENENLVQESMDAKTYLDKLNEIKKNSVSLEDFNKLKDERDQLLDASINNFQLEAPDSKEDAEQVDIDALRKELYKDDFSGSDLEYITKTLKLRQALLDEGKPDPFLGKLKDGLATAEDIEKAQRVANGFQHCVDYSQGDNNLFLAELQRITIDEGLPFRRK